MPIHHGAGRRKRGQATEDRDKRINYAMIRASFEANWQSPQSRRAAVLVGEYRARGLDRPGQGEVRVVPGDAPIEFGRIELTDLVDDFRVRLERAEAMREPDRDIELAAVGRTQLDRHMLPVRGRGAANIDCDIEDRAPQHPDELGLRARRQLKVHATDRALGGGEGMVVLDKLICNAEGGKISCVVGLDEEPAIVAKTATVDQQRPIYREAASGVVADVCSDFKLGGGRGAI